MEKQHESTLAIPFKLNEVERSEFCAAVDCLKAAAGLQVTPGKSIRELLRVGSFDIDLACAAGSRILEKWPLSQQLAFLEKISPMEDLAKRVHIYDQVYQLYRDAAALAPEERSLLPSY